MSDCHDSAKVMQKNWFFLLKKWMKEMSAYGLEFMLTLAKMQDDSPLMW